MFETVYFRMQESGIENSVSIGFDPYSTVEMCLIVAYIPVWFGFNLYFSDQWASYDS